MCDDGGKDVGTMIFEVGLGWLVSRVAIGLDVALGLLKLLSWGGRIVYDSAGIWSSADMRDDFLFWTLSSKDSGLTCACFDEDFPCFEILSGVRLENVLSRNSLSFLAPSGKGGNPEKPNFARWSVDVFSHLLRFGKTNHAQVGERSCVSGLPKRVGPC